MAFEITSLLVLVVTVAAELHHPSLYHDSLIHVSAEVDRDSRDRYSLTRAGRGHWVVNPADGFNAINQRRILPVIYNQPSLNGARRSPWTYLIPIENSGSFVPTTYPTPDQVLPLAAPWTHDVPLAYSTSTTPTTDRNRIGETPFGYVPSVAKISVPTGYKIH